METYRKAYLLLFNAITNALEEKDIHSIKFLLMRSQQEAEELFMSEDTEADSARTKKG